MKTALFTNFTDKEFIGYWDGKGKKFAPGQSLYMPDYLARHFAKHLVNQELLRTDANGNLIHKDGDKMTSPKKPEQVPIFMDLFNKAFTPDDTEELGAQKDDVDSLINSANKNRSAGLKQPISEQTQDQNHTKHTKSEVQDPTQPQIINPPDIDEEEDEEESGFENKPQS